MGEEMGGRQVVTLEDMVLAQMFESETLLNVLERRGLITRGEVMDEVRRLKEQAAKPR